MPENYNKIKPVMVIWSRGIAESLCVDYGHFNNLIDIRRDKKNKFRKLYVFTNSAQFVDDFNAIIKDIRKAKAERRKEEKEIDDATGKSV